MCQSVGGINMINKHEITKTHQYYGHYSFLSTVLPPLLQSGSVHVGSTGSSLKLKVLKYLTFQYRAMLGSPEITLRWFVLLNQFI